MKENEQELIKKRGKTRVTESRLVLDLFLIGCEDGAGFLNQSQWNVKQIEPSYRLITEQFLNTQ